MSRILSLLPTKGRLLALFRLWRPEMYALVAVIAVAGIATAIIGNMYIQSQKQRIETQSQRISDLTQINKDWQKGYNRQLLLRENDRAIVLTLQEHVAHIEESSQATEKQLAELRQTNEEIRNYLNQPIPNGIDRVRR